MTEIIRPGKKAIDRSMEILSKGGIIIYPTDTSYGIGVDASNDKAVKEIFKIKKRTAGKKILVACSDLRMARRYMVIGKNAEKLAKAFMPGPLSLIVSSKSDITRSIGFRIPKNEIALKIIRKLGRPITTTSANMSGSRPIYDSEQAIKLFGGKADLIIDAGRLKATKPSTIYDIQGETITRNGPITMKKIKFVLES